MNVWSILFWATLAIGSLGSAIATYGLLSYNAYASQYHMIPPIISETQYAWSVPMMLVFGPPSVLTWLLYATNNYPKRKNWLNAKEESKDEGT